MAWWEGLSTLKKIATLLLAVAGGSATIGSATTLLVSDSRFEAAEVRFDALERTDSLLIEQLEDIKLYTCLTLAEVRREPTADRCRPEIRP